jgi:hypothetical protein
MTTPKRFTLALGATLILQTAAGITAVCELYSALLDARREARQESQDRADIAQMLEMLVSELERRSE